MATNRLPRSARGVVTQFVVSCDQDYVAPVLEAYLSGAQYVACRVEADSYAVHYQRFTVGQESKLCIVAHPKPKQGFARLRRQVFITAPAGVIRMCMRDDSPFYGQMGIDVKISKHAIQTVRGGFEDSLHLSGLISSSVEIESFKTVQGFIAFYVGDCRWAERGVIGIRAENRTQKIYTCFITL
jgi:hypothetical protein